MSAIVGYLRPLFWKMKSQKSLKNNAEHHQNVIICSLAHYYHL